MKLPMAEMAEPVMLEAMAKAEMMPRHAMTAEAGTEDEVASAPMVVMMSVMPHSLGRQGHTSHHKAPDEEAKYNAFHRPPPALSAQVILQSTSDCKDKPCLLHRYRTIHPCVPKAHDAPTGSPLGRSEPGRPNQLQILGGGYWL